MNARTPLSIIAENKGVTVEHLLDEIAIEESDYAANGSRLAMLLAMAESPQAACDVWCEHSTTHTTEEIAGLFLQALAQSCIRCESSRIEPKELHAFWAEVMSPLIDEVTK